MSISSCRWKVLLLDPATVLVRKPSWWVLHPEKFGESIDLDWQKEQRRREAELDFEPANPIDHVAQLFTSHSPRIGR